MIFLILGIICVISGFAIKIYGKRMLKENESLKYGIIKNMEKNDDGYLLEISYSPYRNEQTEDVTIFTKRKPNKSELILEEAGDELRIYNGKKVIILASFVLWIIGALLCMLA